jgi:hypothetical protein
MTMIYRSPVTRLILFVTGLWAGLVLIIGDPNKWQATPSLMWLKHSQIPFEVWGGLLVLYALMLIPRRSRSLGFALGGALFAVFAVSMVATIGTPGPKSALAIAALVDVVAFHGYAVKTSLAATEAERAERP